MTYIEWVRFVEFGKVAQWNAYNQSGDMLGHLHLRSWGRHKHWSWAQQTGIDMSPGCLDEVRNKMKELYNSRKVER